jgi:hypothetical protein
MAVGTTSDPVSRPDPPPSGVAVVGRHLRRYQPFYVFAALWALMIVILPTTRPVLRDNVDEFTDAATDVAGGRAGAARTNGGSTGSAPGAVPPSGSGSNADVPISALPKPGQFVQAGKTRGGIVCKPGVHQVPSAYAAPCVQRYTGPNGGATWKGVDAKTIRFVSRKYTVSPNRAAVDAVARAAGGATTEESEHMRSVFLDYFNKTFELYGRKLVIENFTSNADELQEVQNKGREQACADATAIATERKPFAVIPGSQNLSYGPFSECAAERGLMVPVGAYGFPESWYKHYHPYVWGGQMDCGRVSHLVAEYVGKRLGLNKARWAKDPAYTLQPRKYGVIGPDIAAYGPCGPILENDLKRYGITFGDRRFAYTVDPSRMSAQAAQAVVQFKAQGVTSLILGCDFLMELNMTRAAANQNWGPEWVMIGAGLQDVDNTSRLFDQSVVDGHLFGLSQLGATKYLIGPEGESWKTYKRITGENPPEGTNGDYFLLLHLFNALQAAGPNLTPQTFAAGIRSLPPLGAPRFDAGLWNYRTSSDGKPGADHTAVDDSREVYWDGSAKSFDGQEGTYVPTYGGKRFTNGQWPRGEPPIYPDR